MDQKFTTQFYATVRGVVLTIEAYALADYDGIYQYGATAAYAGSSDDILPLLTDDDVAEIERQALEAIEADASDELLTREMGNGPSAA